MKTTNDPVDHNEAQWQAQERARLGAAEADPGDLRIARALQRAPAVALPADFAARVAGLAQAQTANDSRFEQALLRGLSVLFGIAALITMAWFGRSWPAELAAALPGGSDAAGWTAVAAGCALFNWGLGLLRRQRGEHFSGPR